MTHLHKTSFSLFLMKRKSGRGHVAIVHQDNGLVVCCDGSHCRFSNLQCYKFKVCYKTISAIDSPTLPNNTRLREEYSTLIFATTNKLEDVLQDCLY